MNLEDIKNSANSKIKIKITQLNMGQVFELAFVSKEDIKMANQHVEIYMFNIIRYGGNAGQNHENPLHTP